MPTPTTPGTLPPPTETPTETPTSITASTIPSPTDTLTPTLEGTIPSQTATAKRSTGGGISLGELQPPQPPLLVVNEGAEGTWEGALQTVRSNWVHHWIGEPRHIRLPLAMKAGS